MLLALRHPSFLKKSHAFRHINQPGQHEDRQDLRGRSGDEYAMTDSTGRAYFLDVLAGTGYTLEELDVPERYVVPDRQSAAIAKPNWKPRRPGRSLWCI